MHVCQKKLSAFQATSRNQIIGPFYCSANKLLVHWHIILIPLINHAPSQDVDTSLVKLLAEERSSSLIPYIENHDLYIAFQETKAILDKYKVCGVCVGVCG